MNKNAATICLMLAGALLGAGPLCAQKPLPVAGAKALVNTNAPKMLLPKNAAVSAPGAGAGLQAATQAAQVQSLFSIFEVLLYFYLLDIRSFVSYLPSDFDFRQ